MFSAANNALSHGRSRYDTKRSFASARKCFPLLAVLLGLSPFFAAEFVLRMLGAGRPDEAADPFVGFDATRPLFVLNDVQDRYVIPPARQPFFKPDSFAAQKSPREFRVFCLGGSTVQGNPYSIETSFTTWLELTLRAADSSCDWRVVNCGGISYASYRLAPILRECLKYQPDLFVLHVGDNEFLEDRTYADVKQASAWRARVLAAASSSRLFNLARQAWRGQSTQPTNQLPGEVEARLDFEGGLAQYHRDDAWHDGVASHFRHNLMHMIQAAKTAHVPVLVVDPVANIKDCPPFKIESDPRLTTEQRESFEALIQHAESDESTAEQRVADLEQARSLDGRHAGVSFQLGRAYLAAGRYEEGREALYRAKDEDLCPLRLTEPLRQILYAVATESGTPVVPALREFAQRSPHGIPGDELLLDHVHPTITGQQLIAELLLQTMLDHGWATAIDGWKPAQERLFREQLATLDAPYYARGQEHLAGLRRWTEGRVKKKRTSGK